MPRKVRVELPARFINSICRDSRTDPKVILDGLGRVVLLTTPPGNGVMMAEGNLVASYNALNQPVAMIPTGSPNIYWFGFDPLGRCVKRVVGPSAESGTATYLYYDGWNLIQEGPSATVSDRIYMLGNRVDEIVADYAAANGQWMFHHSEGRGHNILLTASNGTLAEQNEYDAFGRPYFFNALGQPQTASNYGNRFLFTGREYLPELKLYDYRARMYQPELGRFMQPDPKHFAAGDYNLYRYCHNDPVNRSDPTGLADPGRYSILNCMGGGDWVKDSSGLTAMDLNQRGLKTTGMDPALIRWSDEGNQNIHEPRVVGKSDGKEYNAVTEPSLKSTVEDGAIINHYKVDVRYSDRVGPHNKEMQKKEPEHKQEIDKEFRFKRGPEIISDLNRRGGPLDGASLQDARRMIEHRLQIALDAAAEASHDRHDYNFSSKNHGDHVLYHPDGLDY